MNTNSLKPLDYCLWPMPFVMPDSLHLTIQRERKKFPVCGSAALLITYRERWPVYSAQGQKRKSTGFGSAHSLWSRI